MWHYQTWHALSSLTGHLTEWDNKWPPEVATLEGDVLARVVLALSSVLASSHTFFKACANGLDPCTGTPADETPAGSAGTAGRQNPLFILIF